MSLGSLSRHDAVLVAIPCLLVAGPTVEHLASGLEAVAGVGGALAGLPLTAMGFLAALAVVGHEVTAPIEE